MFNGKTSVSFTWRTNNNQKKMNWFSIFFLFLYAASSIVRGSGDNRAHASNGDGWAIPLKYGAAPLVEQWHTAKCHSNDSGWSPGHHINRYTSTRRHIVAINRETEQQQQQNIECSIIESINKRSIVAEWVGRHYGYYLRASVVEENFFIRSYVMVSILCNWKTFISFFFVFIHERRMQQCHMPHATYAYTLSFNE